MGVTRDLAKQMLVLHRAEDLTAVLRAAGIPPRAATRSELAHRLVERLWWSYCTPLGYATDRVTLEQIVDHTAKRLGQARVTRDVAAPLAKARALTAVMIPSTASHGVALESLDAASQARAQNGWLGTAALGSGATGAFAPRYVSGHLLRALSSPVGRLLPLIPPLAPWVGPIKAGARFAYGAGGPVGVAMTLLTINQAFGTDYPKVVSLVLGLGTLPEVAFAEATEVGGGVGPDDAGPGPGATPVSEE